MKCVFCQHLNTDVIETRLIEDGVTIRRRRKCPHCKRRFTTYERADDISILVVKQDGKRERFNRAKLRDGILKAVGKTTVTAEQVELIISEVTTSIMQRDTTEVPTQEVGNLVAEQLKKYDKVAYIRFASVFRRFVEVEEFEKELKKLL